MKGKLVTDKIVYGDQNWLRIQFSKWSPYLCNSPLTNQEHPLYLRKSHLVAYIDLYEFWSFGITL